MEKSSQVEDSKCRADAPPEERHDDCYNGEDELICVEGVCKKQECKFDPII